ncbi:MAG TPA: hypothetical protein V6D19_00710 [Stenomitos sp.]
MMIDLLQSAISSDPTGAFALHLSPFDWTSNLLIAQTYKEDLFGSMQQAWNNFILTGQVWALIIGFVVGYIFRSITSY